MTSKGFWSGLLTGGLMGAALTMIYLSSNDQEKVVKRVTGKLSHARQMAEEIGSDVMKACRK